MLLLHKLAMREKRILTEKTKENMETHLLIDIGWRQAVSLHVQCCQTLKLHPERQHAT